MIDGVPVANDKKNRRYEFPLDDGSDLWPRSHRPLFGTAAPWEHHFIDGRGESVIAILDVVRWHEVIAVGEAAGLVLDTKQIAPALRADGVRLQDSSWAEMGYIRLALATCSRKTLVWSAEGG